MACEEFKILVADDSAVYTALVKQALAGEACSLLFAKNGSEALELFAQHRPSLVITDWEMPQITGPELCRRIRKEFPDAYTYLMLLTSSDKKETVVEGLSAGADDYLTKPFHAGELVARIGVGRRIIALQREVEAKNRLLEEMALTDPLTGLPNRRAVDIWAVRELSSAARYKFPMWFVMADIDHFKKINDEYGHAAGDTVLRGFADILKKNTRSCNMCARVGGEEFLLILSHGEKNNIEIAIDRIRELLEQQEFQVLGTSVRVTASFGIAGFNTAYSADFTKLVAEADAALYLAKEKGRNRIEFREEVPQTSKVASAATSAL
jgi:diguanylate cyclase (GGDEF)-like protein